MARGKSTDPETLREVQRLLDGRELSHPQIAARTGVSRDTVLRVAAGRYADRLADAPLARCEGCGGLVEEPCRKCAATRPEPRECCHCGRTTRDYYTREPDTNRPSSLAWCSACYERLYQRAARARSA